MLVQYSGMFEGVQLETGQWAEHGEVVDVPDDIGERLLEAGDWERADTGPLEDRTVAELRARADDLGIDGTSTMKKQELIDAIRDRS